MNLANHDLEISESAGERILMILWPEPVGFLKFEPVLQLWPDFGHACPKWSTQKAN